MSYTTYAAAIYDSKKDSHRIIQAKERNPEKAFKSILRKYDKDFYNTFKNKSVDRIIEIFKTQGIHISRAYQVI